LCTPLAYPFLHQSMQTRYRLKACHLNFTIHATSCRGMQHRVSGCCAKPRALWCTFTFPKGWPKFSQGVKTRNVLSSPHVSSGCPRFEERGADNGKYSWKELKQVMSSGCPRLEERGDALAKTSCLVCLQGHRT
jgi:hypothetical protein